MRSHLNSRELDRLVENSGAQTDALAHLEACTECRNRLERLRTAQLQISEIRSLKGDLPARHCPPPQVWNEVAADLIEPAERDELVAHAAHCQTCGDEFRAALAMVATDITAQEREALAQLPSSAESGQQSLIEKFQASNRPSRPSASINQSKERGHRWGFVWAAAGATALLACVFIVPKHLLIAPPDALLARAYDEHRTMELRFPGAGYAPLRVTRGAVDLSPSLAEAQAILARRVPLHPNDPRWLEAAGQAALLSWDFDRAIRAFERALSYKPGDAAIQADLASAYFERAEASGGQRSVDYGMAANLLAGVVAKQPANGMALFNLGLTYEKLAFYSQATATWERYLKDFHDRGWDSEARAHLDAIKKKFPGALPAH